MKEPEEDRTEPTPAASPPAPTSAQTEASMRVFRSLLGNTLASGVTSTFLWFALIFWVFLETRSVVASGLIGGAGSIFSAVLAPLFGTYVDRHRKHWAMTLTTMASLACFSVATAVFFAVDADHLLRLRSPWFWLLAGSTLLGSVAGQMRGIALSTCVTLLVPEDRRDRANGMVGTVMGVSLALTAVFTGLVIGGPGMGAAYLGALALTVASLIHLRSFAIDEAEPQPPAEGESSSHLDIRGALSAIRGTPGLMMLIILAAANNLLAGVFIALIDPYGLSLVSVQTWGLLWGVISFATIGGGVLVSRYGLGGRPLRLILALNFVSWMVCAVVTVRSSIVILTIGLIVWQGLMPIIEAAEQTVLQRSIPFDRQGRVFGFAQLVENAAAPLTAFLMAPLAETVFMPFMTEGRGVDWIGDWFGVGPERGLALMFTLAGLVGVVVTTAAWMSRSYRRLAADSAGNSRPGRTQVPMSPRVSDV